MVSQDHATALQPGQQSETPPQTTTTTTTTTKPTTGIIPAVLSEVSGFRLKKTCIFLG